MKICIFGGQYGSEGKGSYSEFVAGLLTDKLIVAGENSPNSGHTCSKGKVQNLPAASFFASKVLLGPDSVISVNQLYEDLRAIRTGTNNIPQVFIHENAAWTVPSDKEMEMNTGVISRISSTGSGSGAARFRKQFGREEHSTIKSACKQVVNWPEEVTLLNNSEYFQFIRDNDASDWIFECSQGTLLDVNFGRFPYVTSRSTIPRVAVERNGLGDNWQYAGVYRTYPIRTGGPSGPTGGKELDWEAEGLKPEIATVTKRKRRLFAFDRSEFLLSLKLSRPTELAFTHLDYLKIGFDDWLHEKQIHDSVIQYGVSISRECGKFDTWKV